MIRTILTSACLALGLSAPVFAELSMVDIGMRPGWRLPDGDHQAALHIKLAPGWKTYWRAPGDAGIPPVFDWSGSDNADSVTVSWPTPKVFHQSGMRSVGYAHEVVLPLRVHPNGDGPIRLEGRLMMGLCKDICLPHEVRFSIDLPDSDTRPDPVIATALASVPFSEAEAGVKLATCQIRPTKDGLRVEASVTLPKTGGKEETVIEVTNPQIWVSEPTTTRKGAVLTSLAELEHMDGKPFALDRSGIRITVIGKSYAVDVQGCD